MPRIKSILILLFSCLSTILAFIYINDKRIYGYEVRLKSSFKNFCNIVGFTTFSVLSPKYSFSRLTYVSRFHFRKQSGYTFFRRIFLNVFNGVEFFDLSPFTLSRNAEAPSTRKCQENKARTVERLFMISSPTRSHTHRC